MCKGEKESKTSAWNFHEANGDQVKFEKWRITMLYREVNKSIQPHNHPQKRKYKLVPFGLEFYYLQEAHIFFT